MVAMPITTMSLPTSKASTMDEEPQLYWVRSQLLQQKIEAELDYDKEMRQFSVEPKI